MEANKSAKTQLEQEDHTLFLLAQLDKFTHLYTEDNEHEQFLFSNFINAKDQLFLEIDQLIKLCQTVRSSLEVIRENELNSIPQQATTCKKIPQLMIKQIKNIVRAKQKDISNVANKMKVFVCKTLQKESSKLKYNFTCFISLAQEEINDFDISQGSLQKVREQYNQIRSKFNVINDVVVLLYRHHYTTYFLSNISPIGFVTFYIESFLFLQEAPLPFNGNILFAPIVVNKQKNKQTNKFNYIEINGWYINELNKQNANWQNFCLQLMIKNTTHESIKYYFCANYQKKGLENELCSQLRKIRCFVYFSLLFNYLKNALTQFDLSRNKKQIQLKLNQNHALIISVERQVYDKNVEMNYNIFGEFMRYFDQKNIKKRAESSRTQICSNLINFMLCTMAKLKHNVQIQQEYINLRPKYLYIDNKRVQI